ncbi:MAG: hypothetical protein ACOC7U_09300 [Spirochaetota bacterium]
MGFLDRIREAVNQGLLTSREVFEKAGEKTKELGEKGAVRFELMQLENQAHKRFAKIGTRVYEILVKKGRNTVSKSTPEIKALLQEIEELEKKIEQKEEDLKKKEG